MNTTTSASAQSATSSTNNASGKSGKIRSSLGAIPSSTNSNPILTESEQASENAAMAKMFAEVHKAEAQDRIRAAAQAAQPAESTINALCDTSHVLLELWERTAPSLNKSELTWFAESTAYAQQEIDNLRDILSGMGSLVRSDTTSGALQEQSGVSSLLFSVSTQLDTINGMLEIGTAAKDRLRLPEFYRQIKSRIDSHSPDALALLYPLSDEPFAVWLNTTAVEENSRDMWAVNDATGKPVFDLPSLDAAQLFAEKLKHRNAVVSVMKDRIKQDPPEALELRYPYNSEPFSIWYCKGDDEGNGHSPWSVNGENGDAVFDLPSLELAKYVAKRMKSMSSCSDVVKGGAK